MSDPPFTVSTDDRHGLVRIRLTGFWSTETSAAFQAELTARARQWDAKGEAPRILVDLRDFPIQGQDVLAPLSASAGARTADRTAVLVSSSALQKMQVQRVARPDDTRRACASEADALAWLTAAT